MLKDPGEKTLTPPPHRHSPSQKWCIENEGNIYATRSCCLDTAYSPSQKHPFLNRPIGPLPPGMCMVRVGTRCRGSHHFSMSFACHECLRSSKANAATLHVGVLKGHVANIQWRDSIIQTKRAIKKRKPCFALQTLSFRDFRRELASLSNWAIKWSFQKCLKCLSN